MYSRELKVPLPTPVPNGRPERGTWTRHFEKVRLIDIARPFSVPVPERLVYLRVKEWQSFIVQNDEIFLDVLIANLKLFRFIQAVIYEKKTQKMKQYFDYFPFPIAFWDFPDSLSDSVFEFKTFGYSFIIRNKLDDSRVSFLFTVEDIDAEEEFRAEFDINFDPGARLPLVTNLLFSDKRCVYSYKNLGSVTGTIAMAGNADYKLRPQNTAGLFRESKGFFPYVLQGDRVNAFGFDKNGKCAGFSMTEQNTKTPYLNNENVFWSDGVMTPLPPVRITHARGIAGDWIIEDTEGMVDLTFTPERRVEKKGFNFVLAKAVFNNPIGVFNGMLITKDGEECPVHSMPGCAESLYMRM